MFRKAILRIFSIFLILGGCASFLAPVMSHMSSTSDATKDGSILAFKIGAIGLLIGIMLLIFSFRGNSKSPDIKEKKTSKFAIWAIVLGATAPLTMFIGPPVGIIFAIIGFRDIYIKESRRGIELAYVGSILCFLSISIIIPVMFVGA